MTECKDCRAEVDERSGWKPGDALRFAVPKRRLAVDKNGKPYPGPRCVTHHRTRKKAVSAAAHASAIEAKYGITAADYAALYEFQGGRCAICRRASGKTKRLAVDHDHKTGRVRGLLCSVCNKDVVGHARDEVAFFLRAAEYLRLPPWERLLQGVSLYE